MMVFSLPVEASVPNVAVTRAKNSLYIIGNAKYCRTLPNNSPLGQLVKYVDDINPIQM